LRIAFTGGAADHPVLSRISRSYGVDFNILHGQIETIAERPFGTLIVSVAAEPALLTRNIEDFKAGQNTVEHLGYVA
ncbi:NIL domain-containing protein, partial [Bradyrhizobium sp.]|uniref:NIL domain-containing protein n=1 Tax=Bradyrhizobium sp. TaxID=376 RepID=UPI003C200DBA